MADTKLYEVQEDGFINGNHYKQGEKVTFAPGVVKYLAAPYGTRLKLATDKKISNKKSSEPTTGS